MRKNIGKKHSEQIKVLKKADEKMTWLDSTRFSLAWFGLTLAYAKWRSFQVLSIILQGSSCTRSDIKQSFVVVRVAFFSPLLFELVGEWQRKNCIKRNWVKGNWAFFHSLSCFQHLIYYLHLISSFRKKITFLKFNFFFCCAVTEICYVQMLRMLSVLQLTLPVPCVYQQTRN